MKRLSVITITRTLAVAMAVCLATPAMAANRIPVHSAKPHHREVELFAGMKSGDLKVQLIPASSKKATLIFKSNLKEPVSIKLPEAFAGVPIQAQMGMGGMGGMGGGGMGGMGGGGMGGGQGMGGGMGGGGMGGMGGMGGGGMGGMGGGGMGGGGGFFNVAPEKPGRMKVDCVCLEHGKPEPNPRMKYTIVPIESFTKDAGVIEICKMLGRGQVPQNIAQAATWHLTDRLSWAELANKDRVRLLGGRYVEKYFSQRELMFAMQAVRVANVRGQYFRDNSRQSSGSQIPGKGNSLSQQR